MRDLPHALSAAGWDVRVATPSYGTLHRLPGAELQTSIDVEFRGEPRRVDVWEIADEDSRVTHVVFDHPQFAGNGAGKIYHNDEADRPYATDANNFAFYSAIAAEWLISRDALPDVVHLHDWHAAIYVVLTNYSERYRRLKDVRTVFTVHNLA